MCSFLLLVGFIYREVFMNFIKGMNFIKRWFIICSLRKKGIRPKDLRNLVKSQKILENINRPDCSYQDYLKNNSLDFSMGVIINER